MASLLSLSLLSLLLFSSSSAAHNRRTHHPSPPERSLQQTPIEIQRACSATRYPDACRDQLAQSPIQPSTAQIISWALSVSARNLNAAQSMVRDILAASSGNRKRSEAAQICVEHLANSARRTTAASDALSRDNLRDARAWASAVLVYQYDCWSALKYVNDTSSVHKTMSFLNDSLIVSTSNALSLLAALANFGADTSSWAPPRTERSGFWEPGSGSSGSDLGFGGGFPAGLAADATVCKAGCDYATVQEAVKAAPSDLEGMKRHVIHIKEGVYEEIVRVGFEKKNLVLVGDGMGKTVITGSLNTGILGITTYNTATVGVLGDGFMASGITFENTAGPNAHQAVAFRSDSDLSLIENCEFLGNQDTLYSHSLRQLYKSCRIEGNVDFIFGGAAAFFQNCSVLVRPRQKNPSKGENNAVTAHGRTDPEQTTGFVFFGCVVNGTDEYMRLYYSKPGAHRCYLGRPWKEYSRTVFIESVMEAMIVPVGWLPWKGEFGLSTLYYGEYGNTGPGADLEQRVSWSSRIPAEHVAAYSANNFIQADEYSLHYSRIGMS